jgi:hypothetical protein
VPTESLAGRQSMEPELRFWCSQVRARSGDCWGEVQPNRERVHDLKRWKSGRSARALTESDPVRRVEMMINGTIWTSILGLTMRRVTPDNSCDPARAARS